ncbi:MAG: glycosyltransferase family 4 protein [Solirubrobacterales bacterium]
MRLVHLAGYGGPYAGSFVPMLRGVMRAARDRGWSCEAVFGPVARDRVWLDELRDDGIPFRIAPSSSRAGVSGLVRSLLAESDEPTVLHTHFTSFDIPAAAAAGRHGAAKVVWHVHTPHHGSLSMRARNRLKYALLGRRVERILCVSSELADVVAKRGAPRGRVEFLHNAVDVERFWLLERHEREIARLRLGLPGDQPLLVHFGWDWYRKGGDLFMQAVRMLRERGVEAVGVTVGGGEPARQLRQELHLGHAVHVLEPTDDVRTLYAAADVFLSPSRAEGTPYSVMEALSSGTSVVASDIPGHGAVGVGIASCLITSDEPAAITAAIQRLLDREPHEIAADALTGHLWLRDNLHLSRWSAALVDRYEHALALRAHGRAVPVPA